MSQGIIIRTLSEFYTVASEQETVICKARGKFKSRNLSPLVGDTVDFDINPDGKGIINSVGERKNSFIRPPLANLDALVMVVSQANPVTDPFLIDKMAVIAESARCEFIICINKTDLSDDHSLENIYRKTKYKTISVSALTGMGIDSLKSLIAGKMSALTGNSGVGKSSIMNRLVPSLHLETGEVSDRYGRGRHTTRHTELYQIDSDTYVADTAGFSSFEVDQVTRLKKEEVQCLFPEFAECEESCRYQDCMHLREPGCMVRAAVEEGKIAASRYESYVRIYESVSRKNSWE